MNDDLIGKVKTEGVGGPGLHFWVEYLLTGSAKIRTRSQQSRIKWEGATV